MYGKLFSKSSSTASSTPNLTQPSPAPSLMHELTGDIQQGNSGTCDSNPLSASSVKTAINLTLGIDHKLRNKIHSGEYVKFTSLLKPVEIDSGVRNNYHTVEKDGQLVFIKATDTPTVITALAVERWFNVGPIL